LHHVPCLGHVVNLAIQALLKGLGAEAPENDDPYAHEDENEDATVPLQNPLIRLRKGIIKIRYMLLH